MKRIGILGLGAVGGLLAVLLRRSGLAVECVVRPSSLAKYAGEGKVLVESQCYGKLCESVSVSENFSSVPELLIVAVKASGLTEAFARIKDRVDESVVVLPLLNGMDHFKWLQENSRGVTLTATIGKLEVATRDDGVIEHHSLGMPVIEVGWETSESVGRTEIVKKLLSQAGVDVQIFPDNKMVIWRKLVRLNTLAAVTAGLNQEIGKIRETEEGREWIRSCLREGISLAACEGVNITEDEEMMAIDRLPPHFTTSLHRDIRRGILGEAEAILGSIVRKGACEQIPCSATANLLQKIKERVG